MLAGGGDVNSYAPRVAVGSDGRAAATWIGFRGCESNESATAVPGAAFAPPYTGPSPVADPPALGPIPVAPQFPGPVAFRGDGQLVALVADDASREGAFSSSIYDTGAARRADPDAHAVPEPVALTHADPARPRRERVGEQGQGEEREADADGQGARRRPRHGRRAGQEEAGREGL